MCVVVINKLAVLVLRARQFVVIENIKKNIVK